jgi:hypothetical protein
MAILIVETGTEIKLAAQFKDMLNGGALTDPPEVRVDIQEAGVAEVNYVWTSGTPGPNIVRDSTGMFRVMFLTTVNGQLKYTWRALGKVVKSGFVRVDPPAVT